MSSILEALKKAEQESPGQGASSKLKPGAHRLFATQPLSKPSRGNKIPKHFRAAAGGILILGIVCLIYLYSGSPDPAPIPMPANAPKPKPVPSAAKGNQPVSSRVVSDSIPNMPPSPLPRPAQIPRKAPAPARKPEKVPVQNQVIGDIGKPVKNTSFQNKPAAEPAPLPRKIEAKNPPEIVKSESGRNEAVLELEDDSIKIQAISWSGTPENRITVINNRVLNENDSIQDYRIVEIRKDGIILERGGRRYLSNFRYR